MKKFLLIVLASFCFLSSCKYNLIQGFYRPDDVRSRTPEVITLEKAGTISAPDVGNNGIYSALLVTDVHFGQASNERKDEKFLSKLEKIYQDKDTTKHPRFAICLGDMVECGNEENFLAYRSFTAKVTELAVSYGYKDFKFYSILGNHDLYDSGSDKYKKLIFPFYSSFCFKTQADENTKGFWWYCLDSANSSLGASQLEHFRNLITSHNDPSIVLTHYPVYQESVDYFAIQNTDERDLLMDAFAKSNTKIVLGGHHHPGGYFDAGKYKEVGIKSYLSNRTFMILEVNEYTQTAEPFACNYLN